MRFTFFLLTLFVTGPIWGQETVPDKVPVEAAVDDDVQKILASSEAYQAAFNGRDAAAIAKLFAEGAEMSTESETIKGREAIQADFEEYFTSDSLPQLQVVDVNIDLISPSVAIETGTAVFSDGEDDVESVDYRAVHIKTADGWFLDRVQDDPVVDEPPSHYEHLQPLEWMVGNWQLDEEDSDTAVTCRWSSNQNFLIQSYVVASEGSSDLEGTQIIGWDPRRQVIRSWMFDSDGGFGGGAWTVDGDTWTVQTIQTIPSGEEATATNIYRKIDDSTFEFKSIGRQVGGTLIGNVPGATFVRE